MARGQRRRTHHRAEGAGHTAGRAARQCRLGGVRARHGCRVAGWVPARGRQLPRGRLLEQAGPHPHRSLECSAPSRRDGVQGTPVAKLNRTSLSGFLGSVRPDFLDQSPPLHTVHFPRLTRTRPDETLRIVTLTPDRRGCKATGREGRYDPDRLDSARRDRLSSRAVSFVMTRRASAQNRIEILSHPAPHRSIRQRPLNCVHVLQHVIHP